MTGTAWQGFPEDPGETGPEANPVVVPPVADPREWSRTMRYLRWSCGRLEALLDREAERWVRMEERTARAFAAAAGSAVLALGSVPSPLGRAAPLALL